MISRARAPFRALPAAILGALALGCGSETRGPVLAIDEVDAAPPPPPPDVDATCSNCAGGVSLSGLSLTSQHGGDGGNPFTDLCPGDEAVIGYRGYLTDPKAAGLLLVGSVQTYCGQLVLGGSALDQVMVVAGATLPARGTSNVDAWTRMCPPDQVVVGFSGRSGISLDQLQVVCAHWRVQSGAIVSDPPAPLEPVGGTGGTAFDEACPAGRMARGSNVRSGEWIDAFGLACGTPILSPDGGAP